MTAFSNFCFKSQKIVCVCEVGTVTNWVRHYWDQGQEVWVEPAQQAIEVHATEGTQVIFILQIELLLVIFSGGHCVNQFALFCFRGTGSFAFFVDFPFCFRFFFGTVVKFSFGFVLALQTMLVT